MLNTRDLERRWLKYKIKSYIPHTVITLSTIIISGTVLFYLRAPQTDIKQQVDVTVSSSTPTVKKEIKPTSIPAISTVVETAGVIKPTEETTVPIETKKVVLKPSMDFMRNIQESSSRYYQTTPKEETFNTPYVSKEPVRNKRIEPKKPTVDIENVAIETSQPVVQEKAQIVIARKTSLQDIKDAEKRFKQNNSPALSLFLAKQYYALEDYSKSYNYALMTNQLDKNNEDSWLIFSRSLVKLGKPKQATKALSEYIKYSHSNNAEILLNDIATGKFK